MRSGTCPKCQSNEVYHNAAQGGLDAGVKTGDGSPLLRIHTDKGGIFGSSFEMLYFENFVCQSCGYAEHYVGDLEKLKALPASANWKKHSG